MTALVWEEGPIGKNHDRTAFDCGEDSLNIYLKRYARQNHESGGAKCFVATPRDAPARILGFYTLSPASVEFSRAPAVVTCGLGRYEIPRTTFPPALHGRASRHRYLSCFAARRNRSHTHSRFHF